MLWYADRTISLSPKRNAVQEKSVTGPEFCFCNKGSALDLLHKKYMLTPESHVGRNLGIWLAGLHQKTQTTDIGDNKTAKSIYRFAYSHSAAALAKYGFDPSLGERINQEYGSLLSTDNECVCHGDFWPGNVLVNEQSLTVVDWEMVRRGCGATDVGQFAAEASLLDRFRGGRGLMGAFLAGHQETCKMVCTLRSAISPNHSCTLDHGHVN